jgi:hypothetical protein
MRRRLEVSFLTRLICHAMPAACLDGRVSARIEYVRRELLLLLLLVVAVGVLL